MQQGLCNLLWTVQDNHAAASMTVHSLPIKPLKLSDIQQSLTCSFGIWAKRSGCTSLYTACKQDFNSESGNAPADANHLTRVPVHSQAWFCLQTTLNPLQSEPCNGNAANCLRTRICLSYALWLYSCESLSSLEYGQPVSEQTYIQEKTLLGLRLRSESSSIKSALHASLETKKDQSYYYAVRRHVLRVQQVSSFLVLASATGNMRSSSATSCASTSEKGTTCPWASCGIYLSLSVSGWREPCKSVHSLGQCWPTERWGCFVWIQRAILHGQHPRLQTKHHPLPLHQ